MCVCVCVCYHAYTSFNSLQMGNCCENVHVMLSVSDPLTTSSIYEHCSLRCCTSIASSQQRFELFQEKALYKYLLLLITD